MWFQAVNKYLISDVKTPYFLAVGDGNYKIVKDKLPELGFTFIKVSDYCSGLDKLPDIDALLDCLKTAGANSTDKKIVTVGFGEYLALRGNNETKSVLSQLKDLRIDNLKVVLLLRGVTAQIKNLQTDLRFDSRHCYILDEANCNISLKLAAPVITLPSLSGVKALLMTLENGTCGSVIVNTSVCLENALFTIHKINTPHEGIKFAIPGFNLPHSCGTDLQWSDLLTELNKNDYLIDAVFEKNGFGNNLESDFYDRIAGVEYVNWLYFIALKNKSATLSNAYLCFVLDKTNNFKDFKANILKAIIEIPHTDKDFCAFYQDRKILVKEFPESDIADFVLSNRKNISESIFKLTDNTKTEREEVIAWIAQNGIIPQIGDIYPALSFYLKKYVFNCGELSDMLTDYFDAYKRQKITNTLDADFVEKVEKLAQSRDYNRLSSRNDIIESMNKEDAYLYWLDALGVEYLAFVLELVRMRGLSISINIARAELPTITSVNRDFFDDWQGSKKEKNRELDEIKHNQAGGYNFQNNKLPIHLATELDIISRVIDKAATDLALRHYKRFLLVSDHGASRLAVLRCKEEQYETDTKGEHSGRCCKLFEPYDLPFAAEENGYLVLADYGRFKGSRAANVEVHGGASLEEVVVPIIQLRLKDGNITVDIVEDSVIVDFRTGTEITLFVNAPLKNVSIVLNSKRYPATPVDFNHYSVALPDTKRAGDYPADVYSGDDLIGKILIRAKGKSAKVNDAFDDLF
ncbi:MAG: BREX-4 system phosphatase PglZ [Desulfamplus sp.]|nr:BREX-4 system phosphatase PglZ [Desulfamplus sp.]